MRDDVNQVTNLVHCPQCGFLEFDEHSGCAVCGFQSRAALQTGHPALKPTEHKLIEFPYKKRESTGSADPRDPGFSGTNLPLFDGPVFPKRSSAEIAPDLLWKEELQEKLRQYRARRGTQGNQQPYKVEEPKGEPGMPSSTVDPSLPKNDVSAALDEAFKLNPTHPPLNAEVDQTESSMPPVNPVPTPWLPRTSGRGEGFKLPASVQRLKHQQSARHSELFQHPLLFESTTSSPDALTHSSAIGLPIPVASTRDRLMAGSMDLLFIVAMGLISFLPVLVLLQAKDWTLRPTPRSLAILFGSFLIFALTYIFFFTATTRRTPGMSVRELMLVNFAGEPPSLKEAALRTAGYLVSTGSLLLGFIWILFDVDTLAWHDRISRTYPVRTRDLNPDL